MAWNFNGSTDYLAAPAAPVTAAPLTIACWFRKTAGASSDHELIGISQPGTDHTFILSAGDGGLSVLYAAAYTGGSWGPATSTALFAANEWNHAAAVFAANDSRFVYLNGGNKGTSTLSVEPLGLNTTSVGYVAIATPTEKFPGDIAEVAIWSAALTDEEIALLAKGFSPLCLWHRLPNLVMYQDLMRPLDRPGIGPALTSYGGTSVAAHPRMIYPTSCLLGVFFPKRYAVPYRLVAAAAQAGRAAQGAASLAGAEHGTTYPLGEVSS